MKNRPVAAFFLTLGTLGGLSACNQKLAPNVPQQTALPKKGSDVVIAQNHFAFRLFQQTEATKQAGANSLISPISVYLDLSMAYNGAADSTKSAMQQTLSLAGISTDVLNQTNHALISAIPRADADVKISIANAIWYKNTGSQPLAKFIKTNAQYYQAKISGSDFSPNTVTEINHWVAQSTQEKIKSIIERINSDDVMYLINAVYFKGAWKTPFNEKNTQQRPFTTSSGSTVQVPFMQQNGKLNYMENDTLQMVELPYGNGNFSMFILLPRKGVAMAPFIAQLNETTLGDYVGKMDSVKINLWMPKWQYSYQIDDLKPALSELGMGIAFSPDANFSGMYPSQTPMHISKVIHKSYIEVNEQGTEAAAATSIGISVTSMPVNPPPVMDINRPFIYLITEKSSGAVLFLGSLSNPAEK